VRRHPPPVNRVLDGWSWRTVTNERLARRIWEAWAKVGATVEVRVTETATTCPVSGRKLVRREIVSDLVNGWPRP
jgi:hypothetical protein